MTYPTRKPTDRLVLEELRAIRKLLEELTKEPDTFQTSLDDIRQR